MIARKKKRENFVYSELIGFTSRKILILFNYLKMYFLQV